MNADKRKCESNRGPLYSAILAAVVLILAALFTLVLTHNAWVVGCALAVLAALLGIRVTLIPRAALAAKIIAGIVAALAIALAGGLLVGWFMTWQS